MPDKNNTKFAVIFDVDGVLLDSEPLMKDIVATLLARRGLDFSKLVDPSNQNHSGGSADQLLANVKEQFGVEIDKQEFTKERAIEVRKVLAGVKPEPGLLNLMDDLKSHDLQIAIATSSENLTAMAKLEILDMKGYFDVIVTASDVKNHKPHPDSYLEAAKKLGVEPDNCVAIEDSVHGISAANAAGVKVVAFLKHSKLDPKTINADLIVHHWDDLNYDKLVSLFKIN